MSSESQAPESVFPSLTLPPLISTRSLTWAELRREVARFAVEAFDGQLGLIIGCLEATHGEGGKPESYDAAALAELREALLRRVAGAREPEESHPLADDPDVEVVPLRTWREHWQGRTDNLLRMLALNLRKLEWMLAIDDETRVRFLELMHEVRATDNQLKAMFYPGVPTPIEGRKFGGKGFRSTWQEAIVGVGCALNQRRDEDGRYTGDVAAPLIRDLGVGLAMGYEAEEVMAAQLGKASSPMNGGRPGQGGRDLHWGDLERGVLVATAPLAIAASTTTGLALAMRKRGESRVCVSFVGDGASSQGDWYESLNFAGVRKLPHIFFVQNNRVALGTAVGRQSAVDLFADKAAAAGIPSFTVDGANPEELYAATKVAREYAFWKHGGPVLIGVEAMRGCGHAHHDDDRYRKVEGDRVTGYADHEAYEAWIDREPLASYPRRLIELGLIADGRSEELQAAAEERAAAARAKVEQSPWAPVDELGKGVMKGEDARRHVEVAEARREAWRWRTPGGETPEAAPLDGEGWTLRVAVEEALSEAAERWGAGFLMLGEDLEYGGAFGVTQRMISRGHAERLVDTPLAESCIVGSGVGLALSGIKTVAEMQFNAFAAHAFSQIVNNAATIHWRYGQDVPMVIRIPVGAGLAGGPYHALSNEAWFGATPGLKILYPSTPADAYHGLLEAIADPGPVLFLEHLTLYPPVGRTTVWGYDVRQNVDKEASAGVLGHADLKRRGDDLTIVTWGAMVHFAQDAAGRLAEGGIEVEIVDLRSLWPLDIEAALRSVMRTGRLLVLQEATHRGGYGHYVASRILERAFMALDAPPVVLGSMDVLPPFAPHLEAEYMPSAEVIVEACRDLVQEAGRNRG